MNLDNILERFGVFANLTQEQASKWSSTAEELITKTRSRLKPDVSESSYENLLNGAVAMFIYYRFVMFRLSNGDSESFSAGDIKIKADKIGTARIAKKILLDAEKSIAHLLVDDAFIFEGVDCSA